jgi:hypothetical protein
MSKAPGEFGPARPLSKEEREARKAFRQVEAKKALTEYAIAEKAFNSNRERLKAERLAREAIEPPAPSKKKKPGSKAKK